MAAIKASPNEIHSVFCLHKQNNWSKISLFMISFAEEIKQNER